MRRAPDVLMLIELWDDLTVDEAAGGPPRVTTSDPRSTGSLAREGSPAHRGRVSSEPVGVSPRGGEHSCGARRPERCSGVSDLLPPHRLFSHEGCGFS